jgi:Carboxypeptidase regulatory-like domain
MMMMMMNRLPLTLFFLTVYVGFVVGISGCGNPGIGTVPVTGTVKADGQPIEGATVIFSPNGGGRAASGITDAQGKYKLTTVEAGDGALPGSYKIAVTKFENAADNIPLTADPNDSKSMDSIYSKVNTKAVTKSKNHIAAMYQNPLGSGLTAEVKDSGPNNFDFEVKTGK